MSFGFELPELVPVTTGPLLCGAAETDDRELETFVWEVAFGVDRFSATL
jgi:hypothetical protein